MCDSLSGLPSCCLCKRFDIAIESPWWKKKHELADDAEGPANKLGSPWERLVAWPTTSRPHTRNELRHEPDHHQQFLCDHHTPPHPLTLLHTCTSSDSHSVLCRLDGYWKCEMRLAANALTKRHVGLNVTTSICKCTIPRLKSNYIYAGVAGTRQTLIERQPVVGLPYN